MTAPHSVEEALAEIEAGPRGPQIAAFFDLDGTLVGGYTGNAFFTDRLMKRDVPASEFVRTVVTAVDGTVLGGDPTAVAYTNFAALAGRDEDFMIDLGERLFHDKIAGTIRAEARELVRAHQRMGHTVAVASAATRYQIAPVARDLGIQHLVCTELEVVDGIFTGKTVGDMLWGKFKGAGARRFAKAHKIDMAASYAYGNGYEDVAFLSSVGHPRPLNPHPGLRDAARSLGWPVLELAEPPATSLVSVARTAAALGGINAGVLTGLAAGILKGDRKAGARLGLHLAAKNALALAGIRLDVVGREHLETRPAIFIANHQSALDPAVLAVLLESDFTAVAKKEARHDPRMLIASLLVDPVYVDRGNSAQAREALDGVVGRLRGGTSLMIFPEGTRSPTPVLGTFRKGAFHLALQSGLPVVPVVLRNTGEHMWRGSFVVKPGTIEVCVHPPITNLAEETLGEQVLAIRNLFEQTLTHWPENDTEAAALAGEDCYGDR